MFESFPLLYSFQRSTMAEPQFLVHRATHMYMSEPVYFQITQMNKSQLIWVGQSAGKMGQLAVAMPALRSDDVPSATTVLGHDIMERSRNLARRLAIKYKEQFFVSLDLASQDELLFVFVEKKLQELIKSTMT
ncbi:hypothetical protein BC940DRAFT_313963, partial [Gongronella butleri]